MKKTTILFIAFIFNLLAYAQSKTVEDIINKSDLSYLQELTKVIIDSSRIAPGQKVVPYFGPNNTGGVLIKPGGGGSYPSFWIRDYAMSLESGFVTKEEQRHMLLITASTQSDRTWLTKNGSMVPFGSIADHVRIDDGLPIYFPGTYDYIEQGNKTFGVVPPFGDQFLFVHMAHYYIMTTGDTEILNKEIKGTSLIDRLEIAFHVPPARSDNELVYTTDELRGIDFGFRDVITITGDLCFPSILKYRASVQLAELFEKLNKKAKSEKYGLIAEKLKQAIPETFLDSKGILLASTGKGNQGDVWSSALAVYYKVLNPKNRDLVSQCLAEAYTRGTLAYKGNIRHVLTSDDFNDDTAWEFSLAKKNTYQNGAYWGTPTGWVSYAIAQTDFKLAQKLAKEYIDDLRENDFRLGNEFGAPFECFHPSGHTQNPLYMTTVSCPLAVFMTMLKKE
jgi:hypothetical protein